MQKFTKIVIALIFALSCSLPNLAIPSLAAEQWIEYPENSTSDVNKVWTVTLSKAVNPQTVTENNVYVERKDGTRVATKVNVVDAKMIVAPQEPYTKGESYTLYLLSSIQSISGYALPNTKFQFTIVAEITAAQQAALEARDAAKAIVVETPVFANPQAGTTDEIARAETDVKTAEGAIKTVQKKIQDAQALLTVASNNGATTSQLAVVTQYITEANNAVVVAQENVSIAKQRIKEASANVNTLFTVSSVYVPTSNTVKVVLAKAPEYELTTTDKSKFRVKVDSAVVDVSKVVKDATDATGKTYILTIATTLANKQGALSVNNIEAIILGSDYGYDFQSPTITSVEVIDSLHIKVNFSEKMGDSATTVGNYSLSPFYQMLKLGILSTDRKSVTWTLNNMNALSVNSYTLKVTGAVTDIAGQPIVANSEKSFTVTSNQLVDNTAPTITATTYNSSTGVLEVSFDEEVNTPDITKFSLGGIQVETSTSVDNTSNTTYKITLTDAKKLEVYNKIKNTVTKSLTLTVAAGAVVDRSSISNISQNINVTMITPPIATTASYSEYTKQLRLTFDQAIRVADNFVDKTKMAIAVNNASAISLTSGTIQTTQDGNTLVIELTKADYAKIESVAGNVTAGKITLLPNAVQNATTKATSNGLHDVALMYIQDTGKPSVVTATATSVANYDNDTITVQFSEPMDEASVKNYANYIFETNGIVIPWTASNTTFQLSKDSTTVTITLKGIHLQTGQDFKLQVSNVKDLVGEGLNSESVDNNVITGKVVGDITAPTITSVTGSTNAIEDTVTITFSEAVKKETAENIENYVMTVNATAITAKPTTVTYTETNGYQVVIKYPTETLGLASGGKVFVGNATETTKRVQDLAGNTLAVPTAAEGEVTDGIAPKITSVIGKTVQSGLDEVSITFSEKVTDTTAKNPANYTLTVAGNLVSLANLTTDDVLYDVNSKTVTLRLDTSSPDGYNVDDYALKNGAKLRITVNNVLDDKNNIIIAPNNTLEGTVSDTNNDTNAGALDQPSTTVKVTSATTVQFIWNEELDSTTLTKEDFKLVKGNTDYPIVNAVLDATKKVVTLTTSKPIAFSETGLTLLMTAGNAMNDLAGNKIEKMNDANSVIVLGAANAYTLNVTSTSTTAPSYVSQGTAKQISNVFKLEATTMHDEALLIDTLSFNIDAKTRQLNNVQLMWSEDDVIGNDKVVSTKYDGVSTSIITFANVNEELLLQPGYVYVVADISDPGTVQVGFTSAKAITKQTKFTVMSTTQDPGKLVNIDTVAPIAVFDNSPNTTSIKVKIEDDATLLDAYTKAALAADVNYGTMFEIVGSNTEGTKITSATYDSANKTFIVATSAGLPTDGYICMKDGQVIDAAGNPLIATYVAQGNGIDQPYVNPYELNKATAYNANIVQNVTGTADATYGPSTSTAKQVTGDVTVTGDASGVITLRNIAITGNLTINVPNATIILEPSVTVLGTMAIQNAKQIQIRGTVPTMVIAKTTALQIDAGAIITKLTVNSAVQATITNNGVISELAGTGIAFVSGNDVTLYSDTVHRNTALMAINNATTAAAIGDALVKYAAATALNLDGTKLATYNSFTPADKTIVNTAVYQNGTKYTELAAIKTKFETTVALTAVNAATNETEMSTAFRTHADALGINLTNYNNLTSAYQTAVQIAVFSGGADYANIAAFTSAFNSAVAIQTAVKAVNDASNADETATALSNNATVLAIDFANFNTLDAAYKLAVNSVVYNSGIDYATATAVKTAFETAVATQKAIMAINNAITDSEIATALTTPANAIALGITLTDYNALSQMYKTEVNNYILAKDYTLAKDITTDFTTKVAELKPKNSKDTVLAQQTIMGLKVEDKLGSTNNGKVTVSWTPLTDAVIQSTGTTKYVLYYIEGDSVNARDLSKDTTSASRIDDIIPTTSSEEIGGLDASKPYKFVIYAVNGNGAYSKMSTAATGQAKNYVAATAGKVVGTVVFADDNAVKTAIGDAAKTFTVTIDGAASSVTVEIKADVTTKQGIVDAINNTTGINAIANFEDNKLVITSKTTGTKSTVKVSGTNANVFFGTTPTEIAGVEEVN